MELLIALLLIGLLDIAALRWGADSRVDARDIAGTGGILPLAGESGGARQEGARQHAAPPAQRAGVPEGRAAERAPFPA